jgi:hypothetical protein
MARVNRFLGSAAVCFIALLPLNALAASPSPSPGLDTVLAPAPSGYVELTTATLHGEFTAHDWAVNASGASAQETETTLNRFGFVDGYGKEWNSTSLRRGVVEAVMAFSGGSGAKKALTALESTDKADSHYSHSDTITGINPYYGAHFTPTGAFEDEFVFVKGNDLFIVIFAGAQDTVLTPATDQAKAQYDSAPAETIPSSQWPENQQSSSAFGLGSAIGVILPILVVGGIIAAVIGVIRRRQRPPAMAVGTYAPPSMSPTAEVQMSPDGNFWWDGQAWKDAAHEAPPFAQRSSDGSLWWDGRTWRAVPQGQQPPAG